MRTHNLSVTNRSFYMVVAARNNHVTAVSRTQTSTAQTLEKFQFGDGNVIQFGDGSDVDAGYIEAQTVSIGLSV